MPLRDCKTFVKTNGTQLFRNLGHFKWGFSICQGYLLGLSSLAPNASNSGLGFGSWLGMCGLTSPPLTCVHWTERSLSQSNVLPQEFRIRKCSRCFSSYFNNWNINSAEV